MNWVWRGMPLALLCGCLAVAGDEVVFRSDVSLVRIDAQVVDRDNRAITTLGVQDFVLKEEGRSREIRNFGKEDYPLDVLLLLDVSASMRPHVERIAEAASEALHVLGKDDRVGVMVFDRATRVRLPFRSGRDDVRLAFDSLLRQESFRGGTDITRGLIDAARYVALSAKKDARRAIVILTDDQTELDRDDAGVARELGEADAVLSALIAPNAMAYSTRVPRGGGQGGGWPGVGGTLPDIIFGRRTPQGGGPGMRMPRTKSAGTEQIARESGGDSMPVEDATALETTLARVRQRYSLHFLIPEGAKPAQERRVEVVLSDGARRRYPNAQVRYRGSYRTPATLGETAELASAGTPAASDSTPQGVLRRRPVVNESEGPRGPNPQVGAAGPESKSPQFARPAPAPEPKRGWRRVDEPEPATATKQ